jgi:hypothetical protein
MRSDRCSCTPSTRLCTFCVGCNKTFATVIKWFCVYILALAIAGVIGQEQRDATRLKSAHVVTAQGNMP